MCSKKFLKSLKILTNPSLVMLQAFFAQRGLKGKLCTQRALKGHSKVFPGALQGHLGTLPFEGHSRHLDTSLTWALGHLVSQGTWTLEHFRHSKGTSRTRALGHLRHSRHFI